MGLRLFDRSGTRGKTQRGRDGCGPAARPGHARRDSDALKDDDLAASGAGAAGAGSGGLGHPPGRAVGLTGVRRCPICGQWYGATPAHPDCPWCSDES